MAIKELQARLGAVRDELTSLSAKAQTSDDENAKIGSLIEEGNGLKARIEQLAKAGELLDWAGQSAGVLPMASNGANVDAFKASGAVTVTNQGKSLLINDEGEPVIPLKAWNAIRTDEYKSAFKTYLRRGREGLSGDALKVLQEGNDEAGGYLVPEDLLNRLISREPAPQTVASMVTQLNTSRDVMTVPKVNYTTDNQYTSGMRVTWTGETVAAGATSHRVTDPVFGQIRIPVYTAMMSLPLTNDMIEDSSYNITGWCESKFGETIALLKEDMSINGTGVNQPSGILVNPGSAPNPVTVASGAASALTADGLLDLAFSLPEQYDRNARMVLNKTNTGKAIAKMKDGDGRYLLGSGLNDNGLSSDRFTNTRFSELAGYPVIFNAFMPDIASDAYPIIFGDFSGYYLVNRVGLSIQVLRELYAETNQVLLLGRIRFGGLVVEDFRLKVQTVSAS